MLCGPFPFPSLGLPGMLQGSEPDPWPQGPPKKDASVPMGLSVTHAALDPWVSSQWALGLLR